ncbi:MAG: urease accessory protein UreD [Phormidesmis sp.]
MSVLSSVLSTEHSQKKQQTQEQKQQQQKSQTEQLALTLGCVATGKTVLKQRYMSYPLSVSPIFRLDKRSQPPQENTRGITDVDPAQRAYLYRMNTSPGLLAGDVLRMSLTLEEGSSLLLADQAATKVHTMPLDGPLDKRLAKVHYEIEVGDRATLEFLPEPLILFTDSALKQTTDITLHPSAGLTWGEIILPGRLARGERYQFQEYLSRVQIKLDDDTVWFVEAVKLLGKTNPFAHSELFASGSVLGSLILALPQEMATRENLTVVSQQIDRLSETSAMLEVASSVLPGERGLFVRAIASTTRDLQSAFKAAANCIRHLRNQSPLPYSL